MKGLNTKPFWKALGTAIILGLIVLSSPCSVRNHLERVLEVEQTDVSNKSKTTVCVSHTVQGTLSQLQKEQTTNDDSILPLLNVFTASEWKLTGYHLPNGFIEKGPPNVPFYILYGNSKYHL